MDLWLLWLNQPAAHRQKVIKMNKSIVICLFLFIAVNTFSQQLSEATQRVFMSVENMQSVMNLNKMSQTGITFDTRYEGIKGTPRMADTLLPSFLMLAGQDYYFEINADLDLVNNTIIYARSGNTAEFSIPAQYVKEVIINMDGREVLFRTTSGRKFDKGIRENRFYQVIGDGEYEFIKVPMKNFVTADYKGAYSADRRYDEYVNDTKYYIKGSEGIFQQVQLNKKSIVRAIPEKKDIIEKAFSKASGTDKEALVISILEQF